MAGLFSVHMDLKLASLMLIVLLLFTLVRGNHASATAFRNFTLVKSEKRKSARFLRLSASPLSHSLSLARTTCPRSSSNTAARCSRKG